MGGVVFGRGSAKRIAAAVRKVEGGQGTGGVSWHPYRPRPQEVVIGKTETAWSKGATANIMIWAGSPLASTGTRYEALNLFANVAAGRWVLMLDGYLVSAEC